MTRRRRLDQALVERGLFPSRARAQSAIEAGLVTVDGKAILKPSTSVSAGEPLGILGDVHDYVSRGGLKLEAALGAFGVAAGGCVCIDLGASTGGFTEALLRRGAARVFAVDVGHGQLHPRLAADPRVVNLERTHAKELTREIVPEPVDLIVCDVSFIGLRKAAPPALALAAPCARLVALVKPQFEVGPAGIGKGGIVKEAETVGPRVAKEIAAWLRDEHGFQPLGLVESPVAGGDGNREYFIAAARQA